MFLKTDIRPVLVTLFIGSGWLAALTAQAQDSDVSTTAPLEASVSLPSPTPSPEPLPTTFPTEPPCSELELLTLSDAGEVSPDLSTYRAAGANPGGSAGALNTCLFESRSTMTDSETFTDFNAQESVEFGRSQSPQTQDYSRGVSEGGGHEAGGFYSYHDVLHDQRAILIQPSGSFYTPGYLILRVKYIGESTVEQLRVNFRQYQLNDQSRSSLLRLSWTTGDHDDEQSYQEVFVDREVKEAKAGAQLEPFCESELISGANLMQGQFLYLRWEFSDLPGEAGQRDEVGLGSITLTTDTENMNCIGEQPDTTSQATSQTVMQPTQSPTPDVSTTSMAATTSEEPGRTTQAVSEPMPSSTKVDGTTFMTSTASMAEDTTTVSSTDPTRSMTGSSRSDAPLPTSTMAMVVANQTNSSGSNTGKIVGGVIGGGIVIVVAGGGLYAGKKLYDKHQARQKSGTGGVETGEGDWQTFENEDASQYETGDALGEWHRETYRSIVSFLFPLSPCMLP